MKKLFKIYHPNDPLTFYIGITSKDIDDVIINYKRNYKRFLENKEKFSSIYNIFQKHDTEVKYEIIEENEDKNILSELKKQYNDVINKEKSLETGTFESNSELKTKLKLYQKRYYQNNKERLINYQKEYQENNKDYTKQKQKEYYKENKDKIKDYYQQNKDKIRSYQRVYQQDKEKQKKYYKENKNKIRSYQKEYQEKNKNKQRLYYQSKKENTQFLKELPFFGKSF